MDEPRTFSRLFVTLWPPEPVRERLRACRQQWRFPRTATPVRSAKLHLTLHFLGSQPHAVLPALETALALPFTPFALQFGECDVWRHGSAVLTPLAVPDALVELHARLGQALGGIGIEQEARPFRPHVTLARRATLATPPAHVEPLLWQVDGFALVESLPDHGGYTVLRSYGGA